MPDGTPSTYTAQSLPPISPRLSGRIVPFKVGMPAGPAEDFLTGFLANDSDAYGRPVGVAVAADGALLVADEPGNVVWRVAAERP